MTQNDRFPPRLCKYRRPMFGRIFEADVAAGSKSGRSQSANAADVTIGTIFCRAGSGPAAEAANIPILGHRTAHPSCLHRLHQRHDPQRLHHPLQIVGKHMEAHLGADPTQGLRQKVSRLSLRRKLPGIVMWRSSVYLTAAALDTARPVAVRGAHRMHTGKIAVSGNTFAVGNRCGAA